MLASTTTLYINDEVAPLLTIKLKRNHLKMSPNFSFLACSLHVFGIIHNHSYVDPRCPWSIRSYYLSHMTRHSLYVLRILSITKVSRFWSWGLFNSKINTQQAQTTRTLMSVKHMPPLTNSKNRKQTLVQVSWASNKCNYVKAWVIPYSLPITSASLIAFLWMTEMTCGCLMSFHLVHILGIAIFEPQASECTHL